MLKLNYALTCLLASAFVIPAVTGPAGGEKSLARTLDETVRAIEVLAGFQADGPELDDALRFVKASTEAPMLDAPARDERLMRLRDEVNQLAQKYGMLSPNAPRVGGDEPAARASITPGLSGADLTLLMQEDDALDVPAKTPTSTPDASALTGQDTFSADPVRQARASYRAGKYADCLRLVERIANDPEATYWSACALEKLERFDEAAARFRAVVESKDAGPLAERAKLDLEYLEWKRSFRPKIPAQSKSAKETP